MRRRLRLDPLARFEKLHGSLAACRSKLLGRAVELARASVSACRSVWDKDGCIRQDVESAALVLRTVLGAGPSAGETADEIAGEACDAARQQLGAKFASRYGSFDGCKKRVAAKALALAKAAIAKCGSASIPAVCMRTAIEADSAVLERALGLG